MLMTSIIMMALTMRRTMTCLVMAFLILGTITASTEPKKTRAYTKWRQELFPNPEQDSRSCRSKRLCDPDVVLNEANIHMIEQRMVKLEATHLVACHSSSSSSNNNNNGGSESKHEPIELGIVIVQMMDLIPFESFDDKETLAAESFATHIHNEWGVGKNTLCGGTGVLFFLSIQDRAMFLSCGQAIKTVLTDHRLDLILNKLKPFLQDNNYTGAIIQLMDQLEYFFTLDQPTELMVQLREHTNTVGEPRLQDHSSQRSGDLPTPQECYNDWLANLIIFSVVVAGILLCVAYITAMVMIKHSEQQEYAQVQSKLTELDRQRAQALQGNYECTSCPICLEAFLPQPQGYIGSDSHPLKLLRCGHVFDETCWSEWITSGQANVQRCPICQQDVGSSTFHEWNQATEEQYHLRQPPDDTVQVQIHMQVARIIGQLNRERNFRLARMAARFPRYVRSEQIHQWTSSTFDGSLARDPTFVQADPSKVQPTSTSNNGNQNVEYFSGGVSAGGRGDRW